MEQRGTSLIRHHPVGAKRMLIPRNSVRGSKPTPQGFPKTRSITTWEDRTTRFLAQFFPPGRTAKLRNDNLIRTTDQSVGGKLRDRNAEESWALLEDLALYDNESWNDPRDFAKPVKAIALPQDVPSTSDRCLIELKNQDDMIRKINLLWKIVSEKLNDVSTPENVGNSMALRSIVAISHDEREELRKKGIKSPSKLFSLKYLSPASIKELNKNPSAPKRVHFVNSIVILSKDIDTEEDVSITNPHRRDLVEEILEEEKEDEDDENFNSFPTMKELSHHEWLLKNPRPRRQDEGDRRGVRHLMRLEKEMMDNKGEVT
ncbi:hypothetical protein Tco_1149976 [Tanacetum coccineum]